MKRRSFSRSKVLFVGVLIGAFVSPCVATSVDAPIADAACNFGGGGARAIRGGGEAGNCSSDEIYHGPIAAHWCDPGATADIGVAFWFTCHDQFSDQMIRDCTGGGGGLGYAGGQGGTCTDPHS